MPTIYVFAFIYFFIGFSTTYFALQVEKNNEKIFKDAPDLFSGQRKNLIRTRYTLVHKIFITVYITVLTIITLVYFFPDHGINSVLLLAALGAGIALADRVVPKE